MSNHHIVRDSSSVRAYLDISGWNTQDRADLAALAVVDQLQKAEIDKLEAQREDTRQKIKAILAINHVPYNEEVVVGGYVVKQAEQKGPPRVNMDALKTFYPEAWETTVDTNTVRHVLTVRTLKNMEE